MIDSAIEFFRATYPAVSGHHGAFPWQEALFRAFVDGKLPDAVDLPTGCGKTSVIPLWLLGVAYQAEGGPSGIQLPRRLVWVVNRRAVVDQATEEAVSIRERLLGGLTPELRRVRSALGSLCTDPERFLAVSALRGQMADNAEWRDDPARPAIIIGTVDMIGSRLLFSGYGRGFRSKPLHAGFIGQDSLIVHDEAHLEPAFQDLLTAVASEQQRCGDFRPMRAIALTATSRAGGEAFRLTAADRSDENIHKRVYARKGFRLHEIDTPKKLAATLCERALELRESGAAILVFTRRVDDALEVTGRLRRADCKVQELTGTLRGRERDQLAKEDKVFERFRRTGRVPAEIGTVYLVSTSAGEVGIDMSADHMICDLTPFDSMAQRLGRVNRTGGGDAQVEIVYSGAEFNTESSFDAARRATLELFSALAERDDGRRDASPAALEGLTAAERQAAFTPIPETVPVTDILFDAWSMTSVRGVMPGRPPVADWLHGVAEWEPPTTFVAWREEVAEVQGALSELYPPEDLLEDYPLKPHEVLRDSTTRIAQQLEKIVERAPSTPVWLVEPDGSIRLMELSALVARDRQRKLKVDLEGRTVLLPPRAGGLAKGILEGAEVYDEKHAQDYDVSSEWTGEHGEPLRHRQWDSARSPGMRLIRKIDSHPERDGDDEEQVSPRYWFWFTRARGADDDGSRDAAREQELGKHLLHAEEIAASMALRLGLPEVEAHAVTLAARWHDLGKGRALWQRSIGNSAYPARVLAKSAKRTGSGRVSYRHEFGSLIDLLRVEGYSRLRPEQQELIAHFIAAHHGRARPHFLSEEAIDPNAPEDTWAGVADEAPARFARLQKRYGRWGLAYLESVLRATDALASEIDSEQALGAEAGQ